MNLVSLKSTAFQTIYVTYIYPQTLTHLPPGRNGRHFTDDIFKHIFVYEKVLIKISLMFVPRDPMSITKHWWNLITDWRRGADKLLSEPMVPPISGTYRGAKGRRINRNYIWTNLVLQPVLFHCYAHFHILFLHLYFNSINNTHQRPL